MQKSPTLLLLLLIAILKNVNSYKISPVNNSIGLYFNNEGNVKIVNDYWTILVYHDINLLKESYQNDLNVHKTLKTLLSDYDNKNIRVASILPQVTPQLTLINQLEQNIHIKFNEIMSETSIRTKRGIINGLGSLWKAITGNLDSEDGEYYDECIDKLEKDEKQMQDLMKNQIQVTMSTIKNFNHTIRQLQIDEENFNKDIKEIEKQFYNILSAFNYYEAQMKILNIAEQLIESLNFIDSQLNAIQNNIMFSKLKVLHPSIIEPESLLKELHTVIPYLKTSILPFVPSLENLPKFVEIINVQTYRTEKRIVYALEVPLINNNQFDLIHVFALPVLDQRTKFHHIILNSYKYVAFANSGRLYALINDFYCKKITVDDYICSNTIIKHVDEHSECEVQLLSNPSLLPKTCQYSVIAIDDYNVQKLEKNEWLITISKPLPLSINCPNQLPVTEILKINSLLKLEPNCLAYAGTTQLFAIKQQKSNITKRIEVPFIPFDCCEDLPEMHKFPELTPLKINHLNLDDLNLADHKLHELNDEIKRMSKETFASKHLNIFTIVLYSVLTLIFSYFILKCCCLKRKRIGYADDGDDHPHKNLCIRIINTMCPGNRTNNRRTNINLQTFSEVPSQSDNEPVEIQTRSKRKHRTLI